MASFFKNAVNTFSNSILKPLLVSSRMVQPLLLPSRTKLHWVDARMARDARRRQTIKEYAKLRLQINALRYNTILPAKLKEVATKDIRALPSDSCLSKSHNRCVLTSRARGKYRKFRMSRIIFRHLADYNKISGVERAMWGHTPYPLLGKDNPQREN